MTATDYADASMRGPAASAGGLLYNASGVRRHPDDGLGAAVVSELDHLPADPVGPAGVGPRWEVGAVRGSRF